MAYPGYGAPPPGGYGGVSEEGVNCSLEMPCQEAFVAKHDAQLKMHNSTPF